MQTTGSEGKKVAQVIFQVAKSHLKDATVSLQPRPPNWATNGRQRDAVASTARSNGVELVIDSTISKRRVLTILVVRRTGGVLFDRSVTLPKKKFEGAARNLAEAAVDAARKAVVAALRAESSPASAERQPSARDSAAARSGGSEPFGAGASSSAASSYESSSLPPWAGGGSGGGGSGGGGSGSSFSGEGDYSTPPAGSSLYSSRADVSPLRLRLGLGLLRYGDRIKSSATIPPLTIDVPGWTLIGAALELAPTDAISLDVDLGMSNPKLRSTDAEASVIEITTSYMGLHALLGYHYSFGEVSVGGLLGAGYEKHSASSQGDVLLVPGWTRMSAQVGFAVGYHRGERRRMSGRLTLLLVPYGTNKETPLTSGASPKLFGERVEAALRLPVGTFGLFSPFVEAGGSFERLKISFTGVGTRVLADGTSLATDSSESRQTLTGGLSVGTAF